MSTHHLFSVSDPIYQIYVQKNQPCVVSLNIRVNSPIIQFLAQEITYVPILDFYDIG